VQGGVPDALLASTCIWYGDRLTALSPEKAADILAVADAVLESKSPHPLAFKFHGYIRVMDDDRDFWRSTRIAESPEELERVRERGTRWLHEQVAALAGGLPDARQMLTNVREKLARTRELDREMEQVLGAKTSEDEAEAKQQFVEAMVQSMLAEIRDYLDGLCVFAALQKRLPHVV
jgi:hypothetical protein